MGYGKYTKIITPFSNLKGDLVFDHLPVNFINSENIFIGLIDGLAHSNSTLIDTGSLKLKVYLRSISFPGDTLYFYNGNNRIINSYKIPYNSNNVRFTFSSPLYENQNNLEFSYKLEGFDNNWSSLSRVNFKEYTNLHEGQYKMKVKVTNNAGAISESEPLSFTVLPPFLQKSICMVIIHRPGNFRHFIIEAKNKNKDQKE